MRVRVQVPSIAPKPLKSQDFDGFFCAYGCFMPLILNFECAANILRYEAKRIFGGFVMLAPPAKARPTLRARIRLRHGPPRGAGIAVRAAKGP